MSLINKAFLFLIKTTTMKKPTELTLTRVQYDFLMSGKESDKYVNHICHAKARLGKVYEFTAGLGLSIKMRCSQKGGLFTGNCCFVPI